MSNVVYLGGEEQALIDKLEELKKEFGLDNYAMTFSREGEFNYLISSDDEVNNSITMYGALSLLAETFRQTRLMTTADYDEDEYE